MTSYYHGGVIGLKTGDWILPPSETGAMSMQDVGAPPDLQAKVEAVHRRDRIYVCTDVTGAALFAGAFPGGCCHLGGAVYQVIPSPPLEEDPDEILEPSTERTSWASRRAIVVRVVIERMPRAEVLKALGMA